MVTGAEDLQPAAQARVFHGRRPILGDKKCLLIQGIVKYHLVVICLDFFRFLFTDAKLAVRSEFM